MRLPYLWLLTAGLALSLVDAARAADFKAQAAAYREELTARTLPYWLTMVDELRGGYLLADDAEKGRSTPTEKQIVSQARMIWTFSMVHQRGFSDGTHDYLRAAATGVRFLREHMLDKQNGGYYFTTDPDGKPLNTRKLLYGQSFVIYALVEYHRASKDPQALKEAMDLYHLIQKHAHDAKNGGWLEHFERDWTPILHRTPTDIVEVAGYKSANTHLHYMEALTELYAVTQDAEVKASLVEALRLNMTYFYPPVASKAGFHFKPDWTLVTEPGSEGVSYGHNIEFAWLMVRAQETLKQKPSWAHLHNHLEHALRNGCDHQLGGFYNKGMGDQPANDTRKVWWVQAEALAAYAYGLRDKPNDTRYSDALTGVIQFTKQHMAAPSDGIWLDTVSKEGKPLSSGKAHAWKANYHDVRGIMTFIEYLGK